MTQDDILSLGIIICGIGSVPTLVYSETPLCVNNMVRFYILYCIFNTTQQKIREIEGERVRQEKE